MKREITYYADDGTKFKTEKECLEYEFKKNSPGSSVIKLDRNFKVMEKDNWTDVKYLYMNFPTPEAVIEYSESLFDVLNKEIPYDNGYWVWDEYELDWRDMAYDLKECKELIDDYTEAFNKFNELRGEV